MGDHGFQRSDRPKWCIVRATPIVQTDNGTAMDLCSQFLTQTLHSGFLGPVPNDDCPQDDFQVITPAKPQSQRRHMAPGWAVIGWCFVLRGENFHTFPKVPTQAMGQLKDLVFVVQRVQPHRVPLLFHPPEKFGILLFRGGQDEEGGVNAMPLQ